MKTKHIDISDKELEYILDYYSESVKSHEVLAFGNSHHYTAMAIIHGLHVKNMELEERIEKLEGKE